MKLGFSSYLTLIFLQIDIHGEFYGQYFMEDGIGESKKEFCQYYRPNGGKKADQSPKKGRFGKPVKQRGKEFVQNYLPKTSMEHFVKCVLIDDTYNNSICIAESHLMEFFLKALSKLQISILRGARSRKPNYITKIALPWTNFSLCTIEQYIQDYQTFSGLKEKRFFPTAINHKGKNHRAHFSTFLD